MIPVVVRFVSPDNISESNKFTAETRVTQSEKIVFVNNLLCVLRVYAVRMVFLYGHETRILPWHPDS